MLSQPARYCRQPRFSWPYLAMRPIAPDCNSGGIMSTTTIMTIGYMGPSATPANENAMASPMRFLTVHTTTSRAIAITVLLLATSPGYSLDPNRVPPAKPRRYGDEDDAADSQTTKESTGDVTRRIIAIPFLQEERGRPSTNGHFHADVNQDVC